MNAASILGYLLAGLMVWWMVMFVIKSRQHRNDTHDIDLSSLGKISGPGGPMDTGDPQMIIRIEEELKKQAKK